MYKNKLSEWGFSKYTPRGMPDGVIQWIMGKADEREQAGSATEFKYRNSIVPLDNIRGKAKQTKVSQEMIFAKSKTSILLRKQIFTDPVNSTERCYLLQPPRLRECRSLSLPCEHWAIPSTGKTPHTMDSSNRIPNSTVLSATSFDMEKV